MAAKVAGLFTFAAPKNIFINMLVTAQLKQQTAQALQALYQFDIAESSIPLNQTKPEFEGDYTIVLFGFVKQLKKNPDALGKEMGDWLQQNTPQLVAGYNVIKGFFKYRNCPFRLGRFSTPKLC